MTQSYFITMQKMHGSLERLLTSIRKSGTEIVEISARRSLDDSIFFVHVSLLVEESTPGIEAILSSLEEVRSFELELSASLCAA